MAETYSPPAQQTADHSLLQNFQKLQYWANLMFRLDRPRNKKEDKKAKLRQVPGTGI